MSIRSTLAILVCIICTHGTYAQHMHDVPATAKSRLVFSDPYYEEIDFVGANDEGLIACDSPESFVDVWETVSLDLDIDTVWLDVAINTLSDSLQLGLQVYDENDSIILCRDNISIGPTNSFPLVNDATYHMRWYQMDSSSATGHIETSFSHANGIVKCPTVTNFSTQQHLLDFAATYPHCDVLSTGQLNITGDINDLSPLEQVVEVNGPIVISLAPNLTDLNGLQNITHCDGLALAWNLNLTSIEALSSLQVVDGTLNIIWNPNLQHTAMLALTHISKPVFVDGNDLLPDLEFLSGITSLPSGLTIQSNNALTSLGGLEQLEQVGGNLYLQNNPQLADCNALQNLHIVGGKLNITSLSHHSNLSFLTNLSYVGGQTTLSSNPDLVNLNGLGQLSEIDGGLFITDNPSLLSLQGLTALEVLDGPLRIAGNDALGHLSGLANLREIDGFLDISENQTLESLVGLEALDPYSIKSITWNFRDLTVINNPNLSICHSPAICEVIQLPNVTVSIGSNATGCMSRGEVTTYCSQPVLPVEGWEVSARALDAGVQVSWTVEEEINCASYTIIRQTTSEEWLDIYSTSCGNPDTYQYKDAITNQGWVDYQVIQTDYDGQAYSSDILTVHTGDANNLAPYPNPVIDELYLGQRSSYAIYNSIGEVMLKGEDTSVDMSGLPVGIYYLTTGKASHTIVKQ